MVDNIEGLEDIKKSLEEERKLISAERDELETERDRYVKMAMNKEAEISEKLVETHRIKKELERTMKEEENLARLKDILIAALKKDSKLIIGIMKDMGMTKEDLKNIEAYLTDYMNKEKKG